MSTPISSIQHCHSPNSSSIGSSIGIAVKTSTSSFDSSTSSSPVAFGEVVAESNETESNASSSQHNFDTTNTDGLNNMLFQLSMSSLLLSSSSTTADSTLIGDHYHHQEVIVHSSEALSDCFNHFLQPLSILNPNNQYMQISEDEILEDFPNVNTVNSYFDQSSDQSSSSLSTTYFLYKAQDLESLLNTLNNCPQQQQEDSQQQQEGDNFTETVPTPPPTTTTNNIQEKSKKRTRSTTNSYLDSPKLVPLSFMAFTIN